VRWLAVQDTGLRGRSGDHCHRHRQHEVRDSSKELGKERAEVPCLEGVLAEDALDIPNPLERRFLDPLSSQRSSASRLDNSGCVEQDSFPQYPCKIPAMQRLVDLQDIRGKRHQHMSLPLELRRQPGMEYGRLHKSSCG
jgi:hypothetical protein